MTRISRRDVGDTAVGLSAGTVLITQLDAPAGKQ